MSQNCVVIGAGCAATAFVTALRQGGWEDDIQVIGNEPYYPYHRPPLSKDLLAGKSTLDEILIRPAEIYKKANIDFLLDCRAEEINTEKKTVLLNEGQVISYDKLMLSVGSRARKIELPGDNLEGICYLRDINDVSQIKSYICAGGNAVIVGGGYIGLEAAAVLRQLGMNVTIWELAERVLQRVTAIQISEFYQRIHAEEGVSIQCGVGTVGFEGNGRVERVLCTDGKSYKADLVIIGVSIIPNVELAQSAGLKVENGIVVDDFARTSNSDIVAAGDCAVHYNQIYGRWVRLESVQNANDQARIVASTVCNKDKIYNNLPWFWSDQYNVKLQIAGLFHDYDEMVIRGNIEGGRSFAAFYLKEGVVIAVDSVNKPLEFMIGKRFITDRIKINKSLLADEKTNIKELLNK